MVVNQKKSPLSPLHAKSLLTTANGSRYVAGLSLEEVLRAAVTGRACIGKRCLINTPVTFNAHANHVFVVLCSV
jgi:hypothetical protein